MVQGRWQQESGEKQRPWASNLLRENIMHTVNEGRKETSNAVRILAAAAFLMTVGSGYAISTHVAGAVDESKVAIPVVPAAGHDLAPAVYFPAQYVNQAKEVEQHIQAF